MMLVVCQVGGHDRAMELAQAIIDDGRFSLETGDHATKLTPNGEDQAFKTGESRLGGLVGLPDVILVSPYHRTRSTFDGLIAGWPDLGDVETVEDERLREQDHGLADLYNDWRIFNIFHPEQEMLRAKKENTGIPILRVKMFRILENVTVRLQGL